MLRGVVLKTPVGSISGIGWSTEYEEDRLSTKEVHLPLLGLREEQLYSPTLFFHLSQRVEMHSPLTNGVWLRVSFRKLICGSLIYRMIRPFPVQKHCQK